MDKSNYVSLSGALVKDAIIRKNDKGSDYVLFTLSVPQTGIKWYDYINCIAFSGNADIIARSPPKGTFYHIEGRINGKFRQFGCCTICRYRADPKDSYDISVLAWIGLFTCNISLSP